MCHTTLSSLLSPRGDHSNKKVTLLPRSGNDPIKGKVSSVNRDGRTAIIEIGGGTRSFAFTTRARPGW